MMSKHAHFVMLVAKLVATCCGRAETKLLAMRATYGATSCSLATVNSNVSTSPADGGVGADSAKGAPAAAAAGRRDRGSSGLVGLWRAHMAASLPGGGAGEPAQRPPKPPEVCPLT